MTPIFKCLICRKDIERSTKSFWTKKGHLLCSSCLDKIEDKKIGAMVNNYKLALSKHINHKIDVYYGFCEEKFSKLISNFFKKKR